jgi:predicted RNase H-like nuclease
MNNIGVDWSSGSWLAVRIAKDGAVDASTYDCIQEFWNKVGCNAGTVVADVPIGLFEEGDRSDSEELVRECDYLARKVVGAQYRSVFNPPAREVAEQARYKSYTHVKEKHKRITGKGLTRQAYSVAPGIAEVDEFLADIEGELLEGHPEVCFAALHGPLSHSKRTAAGIHERVEALEEIDEDAIKTVREICRQVVDEEHDVGVDDILDALILAYVARSPEKKRHRIPKNPPIDNQERPMQMVYRSDEPFDTDEYTTS